MRTLKPNGERMMTNCPLCHAKNIDNLHRMYCIQNRSTVVTHRHDILKFLLRNFAEEAGCTVIVEPIMHTGGLAEHRDRVFDRWTRLDTARDRSSGGTRTTAHKTARMNRTGKGVKTSRNAVVCVHEGNNE